MKKVLRFLGILILILVVAVVVLGLIAPKEIKIERSVTINAPADVVAGQMMRYSNYKNWNPWDDMDSTMKWEVTGEEMAVGTKYHWKGNDKVGEGEMTTKEIKQNEMHYDLHFMKPMEGNAEGYYKIEDAGSGQTKATEGFYEKLKFPMNGIMMVMNMTGMLEKNFDKGLKDLKAYVESGKAGTSDSYAIKEVEFPEHTYATMRKTLGWSEMSKFFGDSYGMLGKEAGQRITGAPAGIFYMWDEKGQKTDMAAAFPVSGSEPVKGATMVTVPKSNAYFVEYTGGYMSSGKVHEAIGKRLADNGKTQSMVIEEYIVSKDQEPDSNKWVTNIYYILK